MINYDGRRFSPVTEPAGHPDRRPVAHYRQKDDLVWGEFAGGDVRHGSLAGTSTPDGAIEFGYSMVTDAGEVVVGRCHSVPEVLADGRIRLTERWERFGQGADSGISYLEELA